MWRVTCHVSRLTHCSKGAPMNYRHFIIAALVSLILAACDALGAIAPTPPPTSPPTDTPTPASTLTPTPTLGPKEFVDAVYCWKSNIDSGSFGLIRFFGNGMVIDVSVAPFGSCDEAWSQMKQYLTLDAINTVNHGEYHLSGTTVRWSLAAANSSTIIGDKRHHRRK